MAVSITHRFVTAKPDSGDPDEVSKNAWNDTHDTGDLETQLDAKANAADISDVGFSGDYGDLLNKPTIPTGDMEKATYDPTNKAADAFDQDNMVDGTTNKNFTATEKTKLAGVEALADVTDAANVAAAGAFMKSSDDSDDIAEGAANLFMTTSERSKLSGVEALADVTDAGNVGSSIHGATAKTTLADSDEFAITDSAATFALKRITWANVYAAIWSVLGAIIAGGTGKSTPVDADTLALSDSAASNATKKLTWANVKATLKSYFDTLYQTLDSDLTTIAGLTPTTNNFMQAKSSAWASRTPTQVTADLDVVVGDSGSGGTKGLVPAPAAGDAAAGKFLKANGTWAAPSGGGSYVWLSSQTASSSATLDFSGLDTSTYKNFILILRNVIPATDNVNFYLRVGTGAGPTYQTTGYVNVGGGTTLAITMQQSDFATLFQVGNDANLGISGSIIISSLDGADFKMATGNMTARNTSVLHFGAVNGYWATTTAITALRVMFSSGNIASGTVDLYGLKVS